jgi:hypothetical protein
MGCEMSKKSKTPGICVFCGSLGVTKQHIWPDWLKKVIPREGSEHFQLLTKIKATDPKLVTLQPELQSHNGPTGSRKIRNVCAKCNNGWMSKLESSAKPILIDLMSSKKVFLDFDQQEILSNWIVMISIMAEYTDKATLAIPDNHRYHLMQNKPISDGWRIWIGTYSGIEWKQRYRHQGGVVALKNIDHVTYFEVATQFSTFVIGSLLIHATSTTIPNHYPIFDPRISDYLVQIWPRIAPSVTWPSPMIISDKNAIDIADNLWNKFFSGTLRFRNSLIDKA